MSINKKVLAPLFLTAAIGLSGCDSPRYSCSVEDRAGEWRYDSRLKVSRYVFTDDEAGTKLEIAGNPEGSYNDQLESAIPNVDKFCLSGEALGYDISPKQSY